MNHSWINKRPRTRRPRGDRTYLLAESATGSQQQRSGYLQRTAHGLRCAQAMPPPPAHRDVCQGQAAACPCHSPLSLPFPRASSWVAILEEPRAASREEMPHSIQMNIIHLYTKMLRPMEWRRRVVCSMCCTAIAPGAYRRRTGITSASRPASRRCRAGITRGVGQTSRPAASVVGHICDLVRRITLPAFPSL